jgi:C-terminal processing protease CtpA/Prc
LVNKAAMFVTLILAGCGGGGGGGGGSVSTTPPPPVTTGWQSGVFQPESTFAALCQTPRTGVDPITNVAYPDKAGTLLDENNWLRSWSNDLYLWYSEIVDQDPSTFTTTTAYFAVLKTTATTASGSPKDKFHFTYTTAQWESLSTTGVQPGYGPQWVVVNGTTSSQVYVSFIEPLAPANANDPTLARGAQVLAVDGVELATATQTTVATINAGLFPATVGESHSFQVLDLNAATPRTITLVSASVTATPVMATSTIPTASGSVGYLLFNDQLATSEAAMVTAITTLQSAKVTDLVLDIRYNGGGYLDIASEVAYMIAGAGPTAGKTFEETEFNNKHPTVDPVTMQTITPVLFHTTTQGFSTTSGLPLPTLNLQQVFVLTGPDTCSASEAIINGLLGVGVKVVQIGSTTCGKPYGFYPQDNCGTTYFSIEFQGVNAMGVGGYSDGFSPQNESTSTDNSRPVGVTLPGCSVADDFSHALGDPSEGRLAVALAYQAGDTTCPIPATGLAPPIAAHLHAGTAARLATSPLHALRLLRPPGMSQ